MAHCQNSEFKMPVEKLVYRIIRVLMVSVLWISAPLFGHQDPEIAGYIKVDGGQIWYRLNGSQHLDTQPAIIVLHGGPGGTHRGNMPYVSLSDEYPVILYDQLGSGNSTRPDNPENWHVDRFVAEIDHIRKTLNLGRVIVAGHSWGGSLAAEYAVLNPPGLEAAILSSPLINTQQWIADNQVWIEQLPEETRETLRKHESEGTTNHEEYRAAEEIFLQSHMCRKDPCPGERYRVDGPSINTQMYETMWGPTEFFAPGSLKNYDVSTRLPGIRVPTLMICGEYDEAVPRSCQKYAGMIDGAQIFIVPGAGHSTMREDEALYIQTVRAFLAERLDRE